MTTPESPEPDYDETLGVFEPTEQAPRDRHYHAKQPPRLSDDDLAQRT